MQRRGGHSRDGGVSPRPQPGRNRSSVRCELHSLGQVDVAIDHVVTTGQRSSGDRAGRQRFSADERQQFPIHALTVGAWSHKIGRRGRAAWPGCGSTRACGWTSVGSCHAEAAFCVPVTHVRAWREVSAGSHTVAACSWPLRVTANVIYSASDLAAAARCEYALLRSFDAQLGWGPPVAVEDELLARTAKLGGEHEQRHLDELRELADDNIAIIGRPTYTVAGLTAAAEQTMRAVERRAPVIYQAAMFDGRFVGFADFLVFDGRALPAARHQAGPLGQGRGAAATRRLRRHAGRGGCTRGPRGRIGARRRRHRELPRRRAAAGVPAPPRRAAASARRPPRRRHRGHVGGRRACGRASAVPSARLRSAPHDDLLLVAGMRVSQRARLIDAGHRHHAPARRPHWRRPERVHAHRQDADRAGPAAGRRPQVDGKPPYRGGRRATADGAARREQGRPVLRLRGRPAVDRRRPRVGAGIPVGRADHHRRVPPVLGARPGQRTPGTDRLPGDGAQAAASAIPACTSTTTRPTRRARCCGWPAATASARTKSTTCCATASWSTCIPLVRKSIRVGTENYSIKSLEPLYMGNELRSGEVTTATDSITQYARYCALRDEGRADEAASVLKEIEDYNLYDCRSTRRLRDWMMARAIESGVPPRGPQPVRDDGVIELGDDLERKLLQVRRRRRRGPHRRTDRSGDGRGCTGFSQARGQAVLVEPLRPRQQSRRRVGGQHRRLHRRDAPRSSTTGTSRRRPASHSGTCG